MTTDVPVGAEPSITIGEIRQAADALGYDDDGGFIVIYIDDEGMVRTRRHVTHRQAIETLYHTLLYQREAYRRARLIRESRKPSARRALPAEVRFAVLRRDGFRCRYCGAGPDVVALHVGHVVPVALEGSSDPANLVTACQDCNLGKRDSTLGEE